MESKKSLLSFEAVLRGTATDRERIFVYRCLQIAASELAVLERCNGNGFRCLRCRVMVSPSYRRQNRKCPYCRYKHFEPAQVHASMMATAMERWHEDPETKRSAQWRIDETDLLPWIELYQKRFMT